MHDMQIFLRAWKESYKEKNFSIIVDEGKLRLSRTEPFPFSGTNREWRNTASWRQGIDDISNHAADMINEIKDIFRDILDLLEE